MRKNKSTLGVILLLGSILSAFHIDDSGLAIEYPVGWPEPVYDFSKNPISPEGIELGRSLFYDPLLSVDSSISCANCHLSYTAFTHVDHALSHGVKDSVGNRNSMTLMNLAWSTSFMWDGAVNHLDMQALAPISHPAEMASNIKTVVERLNASNEYRSKFHSVFGEDEIDGSQALKALAQFQLTLISCGSKYDRVMAKEVGVAFTEQEERGYDLFKTNCSSCHQEPLFTTGTFANNGLPLNPKINDLGRMHVTSEASDSLRFKIPTLRNIEFSKPYMHDGRFKTLNQVLDHYRGGIVMGPTLAPELQDGLRLSADEKVELISFLLTLSDREFLFNPNHAFPKKK